MKEEEIVRVLEAISLNLGRIASALEDAVNAAATQRMETKPMVTIVRKHSYGRKGRSR